MDTKEIKARMKQKAEKARRKSGPRTNGDPAGKRVVLAVHICPQRKERFHELADEYCEATGKTVGQFLESIIDELK